WCWRLLLVPRGLWWLARHIAFVLWRWTQSAWRSFIGPKGYLAFVTLITAYFGLYSLLLARHERLTNRALFERSTFISMVSSGNRGSFIAAMKNFGPIQNVVVPPEPSAWPLFKNWWSVGSTPNKEPLWLWARHFLALCTPEQCGDPTATFEEQRRI